MSQPRKLEMHPVEISRPAKGQSPLIFYCFPERIVFRLGEVRAAAVPFQAVPRRVNVHRNAPGVHRPCTATAHPADIQTAAKQVEA